MAETGRDLARPVRSFPMSSLSAMGTLRSKSLVLRTLVELELVDKRGGLVAM